MLKTVHVVDGFRCDAVACAGREFDSSSWSVSAGEDQVAEHPDVAPAAPEVAEGLRLILGLSAAAEPVLARLVRLASDCVCRPWGKGDGWVGLHVLARAGKGPAAFGSLSVLRPTSRGDEGEPGWELTLHLPLEVDRLFVFRRSLACKWSLAQPECGSSFLLARAFLVPDPVS